VDGERFNFILGIAAEKRTRLEGDELASWSSQWGGRVCCVVVVAVLGEDLFWARGTERMSKIRRRKGAAEQQPGDNKATTGTTTTATARTKKAARREREREREEKERWKTSNRLS
jgi:hypothetical protein